MNTRTHAGIALIEVLIGIAIVGAVLVVVSHTIILFLDSSEQVLRQTQAVYLAEEGQELMRYLRDENWNTIANLSEGTVYYLSVSTSTVSVTTTAELIDGRYTRSITIDQLRRDAENDVVTSGGSVDPEGRMVSVDVTWDGGSVSLSSIITNLYDL